MQQIADFDVAVGGANVRVRSRRFVGVRRRSGLFAGQFAVISQAANVRVRSRLFATSRDCSHFLDVGNVSLDRVGRDEVFFAGLGLNLAAIELVNSAVFLDSARRAGVTGQGVQLGRFLDGEGILVVRRTFATGRVRSRLFGGHWG